MENAIKTQVTKANEVMAPAMSASQFEKHLEKIAKDGQNLSERIQIAGMYSMNQAASPSGNFDAFFKTYQAIAKGLNIRSANQFRLWAESFAPVKFIVKDGVVIKARKTQSENASPFNLVGASETPWNKMEGFTDDETKSVLSKLFTADKVLDRMERMIETLKKTIEKGEYASDSDRLAMPAMLEKLEVFKAELSTDLDALQPVPATTEAQAA